MTRRLFCSCLVVKKSLSTFHPISVFQKRAMSAWVSEKSRILGLPLDKKRALYAKNSFVGLDGVKTWKETAEELGILDTSAKSELIGNSQICNKISIYEGDITQLEIDAIVNAANSRLAGGGGVDGAIHRAAGSFLKEECLSLGGCQTGDAKFTGGYNLPAKYVIHTVGPQDKSADKLKSCYEKCLSIVRENGLKSVAFPCVSTGIYGFPNEGAAHIACSVVRDFLLDDLKNHNGSIDRIIFCVFLKTDLDIYKELCNLYFPFEPKSFE